MGGGKGKGKVREGRTTLHKFLATPLPLTTSQSIKNFLGGNTAERQKDKKTQVSK